MKIRFLIIVNGSQVFCDRKQSLQCGPEKAIELAEKLRGKAGYGPKSKFFMANFKSFKDAEDFCKSLEQC